MEEPTTTDSPLNSGFICEWWLSHRNAALTRLTFPNPYASSRALWTISIPLKVDSRQKRSLYLCQEFKIIFGYLGSCRLPLPHVSVHVPPTVQNLPSGCLCRSDIRYLPESKPPANWERNRSGEREACLTSHPPFFTVSWDRNKVHCKISICYFDNCICHQSCNCWLELSLVAE